MTRRLLPLLPPDISRYSLPHAAPDGRWALGGGRCSGLPPEDYFALARRAYDAVTRPEVLRRLDRPVRLPARVIEEAFLAENPGWTPDMLTVTCRSGRIQEARLCLSRALDPVPCGRDVVRDCALDDALLAPLR